MSAPLVFHPRATKPVSAHADRIYPPEIWAKYGTHLKRGAQARPVMLICETVNKCSLNCIICAYGDMQRPKQVMPLALFERVLQDYSAIGGGPLSLTPVVGDIFMDTLLFERFAILDRYPAITSLSVVTNAIGLKRFSDAQLTEFLARFQRVYISVYGLTAEEYFQMSRKNLFDTFLADAARLISLSPAPSQFRFGFRLLKSADEATLKAWVHDQWGIVDAPVSVTTHYANWGIKDTNIPLPHDAMWLSNPEKNHHCTIPLVAAQIHSDGNVSVCPCDDFEGDASLSLGHLNHATLAEMLNSETHARFWREFMSATPKHCQTCSFYMPTSRLGEVDFLFERPLEFIGG